MEKQQQVILLVDDDEENTYMMGQALKEIGPGYEIQQVTNGWEAIARLNEMEMQGRLPCLIILDIDMPKMDGKHTLVAIQGDELLREVPIVILTTSSSAVDQLFFENRQVEMITKPTESEMLYEVAKRLLKRCNP
jgi:CheY-like chemotaxis protein